MPNCAAIGETVAEIWRFFLFFQDGGRRHLGFSKSDKEWQCQDGQIVSLSQI